MQADAEERLDDLESVRTKVENSIQTLKAQETELNLRLSEAESHLHKQQMLAEEEKQKHSLYRNAAARLECAFEKLLRSTKVTNAYR